MIPHSSYVINYKISAVKNKIKHACIAVLLASVVVLACVVVEGVVTTVDSFVMTVSLFRDTVVATEKRNNVRHVLKRIYKTGN